MDKEYRVIIPEENYQIVEFKQNELPGVAVINKSLIEFEPKVVFRWHLSIMIEFNDLIENGMPSQGERDVIDPFGDNLDLIFKGDNPDKPNALFLARITWNETRELIYRVYEPDPIHNYLQELIQKKSSPRDFDYRIDPDEDWQLAEWHLKSAQPSK